MINLKRPIAGTQIAEVLTAVGLILWRIWDFPLAWLWRDWITLLALYWMFVVLVEDPRLRTRATLLAMPALMLLYAWGQFPHLAAFFGGAR